MIRAEYRIKENNEFLDLSHDKVKFNIDHLFRLPGTSRSLVFFPYWIDVEQIPEFNKYCKSNGYEIKFVGGESVYGGKSGFTNGTMTIMLIHESDQRNTNFMVELERLRG